MSPITRKRILWSGIAVGAVVGLYAVVGFVIVPRVGLHYAPQALHDLLGRDVTFGAMHVNPFLLTADLDDVVIAGRSATPLASARHLHVDIGGLGLLHRVWTVDEMTLTGLKVDLAREADGRSSIDDIVRRFAAGDNKPKDAAPTKVLVRHLSMPDATLHYADLAASAPAAVTLGPIALDAIDLSTLPDRQSTQALQVALPEGGALSVKGALTLQPALAASGDLNLTGLKASVLWPFLRDKTRLADVQGVLRLSTHYAYAATGLRLDALAVDATAVALTGQDAPAGLFAMQHITLAGGALDMATHHIQVASLDIGQGQATVAVAPDGGLNWSALTAAPKKPASPATPAIAGASPAAWSADLPALRIEGVALHYLDRSRPKPLSAEVASVELRLAAHATDLAAGQMVASGIDLALGGLALGSQSTEPALASLAQLDVSGGHVDIGNKRIGATALKLAGGSTSIVRRADGRIDLLQALGFDAPAAPQTGKASAPSTPWHYAIDDVTVENLKVDASDRSFQPAIGYGVTLTRARASHVADDAASIPFDAKIAVRPGGSVAVTGRVAPDVSTAQAQVKITGLALLPLKPVVMRYAGLDMRSAGPLTASWTLDYAAADKAAHELSIQDLALSLPDILLTRPAQGAATVSLKTLELAGGALDLGQRTASLKRLSLAQGDVHVGLTPDGGLDLPMPASTPAVAPAAKPATASPAWQLRVDTLALDRIGAHVTDRSRTEPLVADVGAVDARLKVAATVGGAATQLVASDIGARISGVKLSSAGQKTPWFTFGDASVVAGRFDLGQRRFAADSLGLQGGSARVVRDADGSFALAHSLASATSQKASMPARAPAKSAEAPWHYDVATVLLGRFDLDYVDRSLQPTLALAGSLTAEAMHLSDQTETAFDAKLRLNQGGNLRLDGTAGIAQGSVTSRFDADGFALRPFAGLVQQFVAVDLASGAARASGTLKYRSGTKGSLTAEGKIGVDDFLANEIGSGERLLSWKQFDADALRFDLNGRSLRIGEVTIAAPGAKIEIAKDRSVNLAKLVKHDAATNAPAPSDVVSSVPPFSVQVGKIGFSGGRVDYADESLVLPFSTEVTAFQGSIVDISSDKTHRAAVSASGQIQPYGSASVEGDIVPFDPVAHTDLRVRFNNVRVKPLSPYTATFAGRKVESGKLWLDLQYKIDKGQLQGSNDVRLADFTLGERVESPGALNLPLNLAVALLTDSKGEIKLSVPVRGDLDNPSFSVGGAVRTAVGNVLSKLVTAPFLLLGRLFGGNGESLASVDFLPGSATLRPEQREKLDELSKALVERPKLNLVVPAPYDAELDKQAIARAGARLDLARASGRKLAPGEDPGPVAYDDPATRTSLQRLIDTQTGAGTAESILGKPTGDASNNAAYRAMFNRLVADRPLPANAGLTLATERARSIASYLQSQGLDASRVRTGQIAEVEPAADGSIAAQLAVAGQ